MLKFKVLTEENISKTADELFGSEDYALEVLSSFDVSDPDTEYAVAEHSGCLLVRIFDMGRYMFVYPIALCESSDEGAALLEVSEYAMREELPLVFTDTPSEAINLFAELGFGHLVLDRESWGAYRVCVKTECDLIAEIPEFTVGNITVSAIDAKDADKYAEICKDEELNRYWGYDYREDDPDAGCEFFFREQERGFISGTSMTLGFYKEGELVGFSELFAFDGRGSCEFAVKIAKQWHGGGYGSLGVEATIEAASRLGILKLCCDVMNENLISLNLMHKYFDEAESADPTRKRFVRALD